MPIEFKDVNYIYNQDTPLEYQGLTDINFKIEDSTFLAVIGHTGSGKSTLLQHFDALLKPTSGSIQINDFIIDHQTPNKLLKPLRKEVGIVFQFPESQLFAETVIEDVMFAPLNFGFSKEDAKKQAEKWLKIVGIDEELFERSPFDLSGGQMRRVAIAGVMAYEPAILCLDEPAAGLDPVGKNKLLKIFKDYQKAGHTVILVSHEMDDVANYAEEVLVMDHGHCIKKASVKEIFQDSTWLSKHHLNEPHTITFARKLEKNGLNLGKQPLNISELSNEIIQSIRKDKINE